MVLWVFLGITDSINGRVIRTLHPSLLVGCESLSFIKQVFGCLRFDPGSIDRPRMDKKNKERRPQVGTGCDYVNQVSEGFSRSLGKEISVRSMFQGHYPESSPLPRLKFLP